VAKAYPSLEMLDHVIALVVAVFVVRVAVIIIYKDVLDLTDSAPSNEIMDKVQASILGVDGVQSLHQCRARRIQGKILVDVHVQVLGHLTVNEGHLISSVVRDKVRKEVQNVTEVLVHIEPV
jgi:divalent metal cation (Fe/Co/Zn/Cd) transporter